jgi:hypothetical protein
MMDRTGWNHWSAMQLPSYSAHQPARLSLFGVINYDRAWREGMYEADSNRYRRILPRLVTDMEGFIRFLATWRRCSLPVRYVLKRVV